MDFEVDRSEYAQVRVVEHPDVSLADGEARIRIDEFGFSSNNISYAVFGDMLNYWAFFPTGDPQWGRIPVWGFGTVVESNSPDVAVGERLYGYYPMSSELVIRPGLADARRVVDVSEHRAAMAREYSSYVRCDDDPMYRADHERHQMVLYPLFFTAFVIDDFLADNGDFAAQQIIVSSASSKTSIGVAQLAHARGARVVGLTSPSNVEFVTSLGVYDSVVTYDSADTLDQIPSVFVDVAGDRDVVGAVHRRLDGLLGHSMIVGGTHWDHKASISPADIPAPAPTFFFAPTQISKRTKEWGRAGLDDRLGAAWHGFADWADSWLEFQPVRGAEALDATYHELLSGRVDPRAGFVCTLVTEG